MVPFPFRPRTNPFMSSKAKSRETVPLNDKKLRTPAKKLQIKM